MDWPDPFDCQHMTGKQVGNHFECIYSGRPVWVDCRTPFCGEDARCRYAPVDNSEQARERRIKWLGVEV